VAQQRPHQPSTAPRHAAAAAAGPEAVFSLPAFFAAQAGQRLPAFTPAMAGSAWEREFLLSVAAQITPGVPSEYKRWPGEGRRLSDKQRATLEGIVARAQSAAVATQGRAPGASGSGAPKAKADRG
jgi:hypothetical protein